MKQVKFFMLVVLALGVCGLPVFAQTKDFTRRQMKILNGKLPAKVRKFLQTAETFEIWTDTVSEGVKEKPLYIPNRKFVIKKAATRAKVLNAFYFDISHRNEGPVCFEPNHSIVARKGKKFVRLTICFGCGKFVVSGSFGEWYRGISTMDGGLAEPLMNRLLEKYGVTKKAVD